MKISKQFKGQLLTIALLVIAGLILMNFQSILRVINNIWGIIVPFIIGGIIAFILNIVMKRLEKTIFKKVKKGKRGLSFIMTLLIFILVIIIVFTLVGPEVYKSAVHIIKAAPDAYADLINFLEANPNIGNGMFKELIDYLINLDLDLNKIAETLMENWSMIFNSGFLFITSTFNVLSNFFIGFIFAVYLLISKDTLKRQFKKVILKLCGKNKAKKVFDVLTLTSRTFENFISTQCLEALILGSLFFISMNIFRMHYALLIAVLIAFTALIPIFGAFIGCFVGIILIGIIDIKEALLFVVLFLVLQQIEGNLIYPHVVGNSINLPGIWVFAAVIVGGSLMGIMGMLIFIPLTSVGYTLFKQYINNLPLKE